MLRISRTAWRMWSLVVAGMAGVALAGCGDSAGSSITTVAPGTQVPGATSSGTSGMNMGGSAKSMKVDGITPIPIHKLATATWQDMRISAEEMTAVPFFIFNGTHEQKVNMPKHTSFHLMVMLNDARTNVAIPYASVWATIRKNGRVVYDERQWPMLSEYMGPHYGNNVSLPGAGEYQLSLLISPPVSARHIEYKNVWLKPHRVNVAFHWSPPS
ncbi:MAG TPA: iron transporter [Solirubrobacteraceae bacterium]